MAVKFSANARAVDCYLTSLSRTPPPTTLPGGYRVGDTVFYAAPSEKLSNGDRVLYGEEGEIVGPATSETHKDNGVAVKFSANTRAVSCYITQLGRTPPPTTLPGGYHVGDTVFYAAPNETFPNGDRLLYGEEGEIVGPATLETDKDNAVAVKFSANTRESCYVTSLSRAPPPTTLPGDHPSTTPSFMVHSPYLFLKPKSTRLLASKRLDARQNWQKRPPVSCSPQKRWKRT